MNPSSWSAGRQLLVGLSAILLLVLGLASTSLIENLESNKVMVIQGVTGDLSCYTEPGPKWQLMGTVTKYPRRGTYAFDKHDKDNDTGKKLQFNDGGKGKLYASVNWEMPLDCKQILAIHRTFNSEEGVQSQGIAKMINSAVYLSGPTMSSTESSAERRGELVELINDQAQHGTYQTISHQVERPDPITGEKRMQTVVEIVRDKAGLPKRQQGSILEQYGIRLQPMAIEKLDYDDIVEKQIAERQKATQQVQLAQANARKAQQDTITAEEAGKAAAAKAKWEQEVIKAKLVTEAEQKLRVAELAAQEAIQYKKEQILRGEGDAERRRLVLAADGALDAKLQAYVQVQSIWAQNFGAFKGQLVPSVTMGGQGGANAVSGASALMEMLSVKTAKDLALDLRNVPGK